MSYEKIAKLVIKLHDLTISAGIHWDATNNSDSFQTSFLNFSVKILKFQNGPDDNDFDFQISIHNSEGVGIEHITSGDLNNYLQNPYDYLNELFETARRQAMGVEEALNSILAELDDIVPF